MNGRAGGGKRICIVTALHLCNNPRVWKEANSLAMAGYEVIILTIFTSASRRAEDEILLQSSNIKYNAPINLLPGHSSTSSIFLNKAISKFSRVAKRFLSVDSPWLLGYSPNRMVNAALEAEADLYIVHVEYGFYVGKELIKRNKKVAFDFEDWYSQDYHVATRPLKLLQQLESFALHNGIFCICPSATMAAALQKMYKSPKPVHIIYNGFSIKENVLNETTPASIIWFSQTIGPGRGLETMIEALSHINQPTNLTLLGNCIKGYDAELKLLLKNKIHTLHFIPAVQHNDLLPIVAKFDIGLAIENDYPENKNTTVSNKILQYLQAGIKTLATNTAGQVEIADHFIDSIETVAVHQPKEWAMALERLMNKDGINKVQQQEKFNDLFSWEAQERKLLQLVSATFK